MIAILRDAARIEDIRARDWIYLGIDPLRPESRAMLLAPEFDTIEDQDGAAALAGFPRQGTQASAVRNIFEQLSRLTPTPSDEQIVRAFNYYLRFDDFLPSLDAPEPTSVDKIALLLDREFYNSLGAEIPGSRCKREGCARGSVHLSLFCAAHHFENVRGHPFMS